MLQTCWGDTSIWLHVGDEGRQFSGRRTIHHPSIWVFRVFLLTNQCTTDTGQNITSLVEAIRPDGTLFIASVNLFIVPFFLLYTQRSLCCCFGFNKSVLRFRCYCRWCAAVYHHRSSELQINEQDGFMTILDFLIIFVWWSAGIGDPPFDKIQSINAVILKTDTGHSFM